MSNERVAISNPVRLSKVDDLKLISRVSPTVETCLKSVGILTFAQLAALSPVDIAVAASGIHVEISECIQASHRSGKGLTRPLLQQKSGLGICGKTSPALKLYGRNRLYCKLSSAQFSPGFMRYLERIIQQDWIGQAGKLAIQSTVSKQSCIAQARRQMAEEPVISRKDDVGNSASTPSEEEKRFTSSNIVENRNAIAELEEREVIPSVKQKTSFQTAIFSQSVGKLDVRELKVVERATDFRRNTLSSQELFDVQLTINCTDQAELPGRSFEHYISIYARRQEDHTNHIIAETRGSFIAQKKARLIAPGKTISPGMYRLWAKVTLRSTDQVTSLPGLFFATTRGGVLLVY